MKTIQLIFSIISLMIYQNFLAQDQIVDNKAQKADFILESQFYPRLNTGVFEPNLKARIVLFVTATIDTAMTVVETTGNAAPPTV